MPGRHIQTARGNASNLIVNSGHQYVDAISVESFWKTTDKDLCIPIATADFIAFPAFATHRKLQPAAYHFW